MGPLLVALALAGCSGDDDPVTAPDDTSTTKAAAPTTTGAADDIPYPDMTGEDFQHVMEEFNRFTTYLLAENPDPDLLPLVFHPEAEEETIDNVKDFADSGYRMRGPIRFTNVEVLERPDNDTVLLQVQVVQDGPTQLLDPSGRTVDTEPPRDPFERTVVLARSGDEWRFFSVGTRQ